MKQGLKLCIMQIQIFHAPCLLHFSTVRWCFWVRKPSEFKITGVFLRKAVQKKLPHGSFWYDEKVVFCIAYIDIRQKSQSLLEIYVGVDNIWSNKQWRNAIEGFCLKILSWRQVSGNMNKTPLQWLIVSYKLPSLFLELVFIYPKNCLNRRIL